MQFSELNLSDKILRALDDAGYTEPTPIQSEAIPEVMSGRDLLGCAFLKVEYASRHAQDQQDFQKDKQQLSFFHIISRTQMKDGKTVLHFES